MVDETIFIRERFFLEYNHERFSIYTFLFGKINSLFKNRIDTF